MGLDTSHNAWHGPYSSFSQWRQFIAETAGVPYNMDWSTLPVDAELQGHWTHEPADAILYLIAHSDCDGELSAHRCARLAVRLTELLPDIPEDDGADALYGWGMRKRTEQFIDGLKLAATNNETLDFH